MKRNMAIACMAVSLATALTVACSSAPSASRPEDQQPKSQEKPPEVTKAPVELTFYYMYADSNMDQFMKEHGSLVQKKYPNFSFKFIQNTKGSTLQDLIAAGEHIDVFITINPSFLQIKEVELDGDITDLVKKYNFDLNRFEPSIIDGLRKVGEGKLPGLPFRTNTLGLFYNKDIFDRFGIPYLKDGMTWDEIYDTAKQLTREDSGVQYRGFGIRTLGQLLQLNQLSHPLLDPATRKSTVNNDAWKSYVDNFSRFYGIAGWQPTSALTQDAKQYDMFFKEKSLAMLVQMNSDYPKDFQKLDVNWDVVSFPTFKEKPGIGPQPDVVYYALSRNSKHRDEAFLAMAELTSDAVQLERSRIGSPSVLKSKEIRDAFGTATTDLNGKNKAGLIPQQYASPTPYTKYNLKVVAPLAGAFRNSVTGQKDVNTALREAEEKANKDIEAMILLEGNK
ncbi:extracellular solute-binding protein [Paenibacillus sp. GD4]|uniref:ABC transporter substrate-binding protein n=1 Tax=Paenibacillus sp. GD4 TaxID=3068890 RepID=UPI0027965B86|nr:extracellular solute-binding protein [Paenibacillus sp. GD4]MDQ1909001.1 extracellular solute-binding protein [Paenibacillus sp. GD4]